MQDVTKQSAIILDGMSLLVFTVCVETAVSVACCHVLVSHLWSCGQPPLCAAAKLAASQDCGDQARVVTDYRHRQCGTILTSMKNNIMLHNILRRPMVRPSKIGNLYGQLD